MNAADNSAPHGLRRLWRRRPQSIKGRLVALFVLLALATTVVFMLGTQQFLQGGWQAYVKPLVADYTQHLATDLGSPPDPARVQALVQRLPLAVKITGPQVQLETHPGRFERHWGPPQKHAADAAPPVAARPPDDSYNARPGSWTVQQPDGHRISFALVAPPDAERPRLLGWATLAALLALTALAYAAVRRQLQPLHDITTGVQAFGAGQFTTPIPVRRRDELGDLATRINTMAHHLNGMLDAKRALLLAMSHELRSPLTRARVNAELLDDSPERQALLRDLGEMRDQITALLEGERLADGHRALHTEAVDLAALVDEVVRAEVVIAEPASAGLVAAAVATANAQTQAAVPGGTTGVESRIEGPNRSVQADPVRLRLLLRNLLQNARRHGRASDGRRPEIFVHTQADGVTRLGVRDFGPGVPAAQLPLLAQAFYRPDGARTRSTGGVGLGLYLCRLVAQAHGGELQICNTQPGLEVAMVWRPEAATGG